MKILRKAIAYFAIYNVVSIIFSVLAVTTQDKGTKIDYLGVAAGVYMGIAVVFLLIAISSLAIDEILK
jgi:succinate-acetate transporter protein